MLFVKVENESLVPKTVNDFLEIDVLARPGILDFDGGQSVFGLLIDVGHTNLTAENKDLKIELADPGSEKKGLKNETDSALNTDSEIKDVKKEEGEEEEEEEEENFPKEECSYRSLWRTFKSPKKN